MTISKLKLDLKGRRYIEQDHYKDKKPSEYVNYVGDMEREAYYNGMVRAIPKFSQSVYENRFNPPIGQVKRWDYYTENESDIIDKAKSIFREEFGVIEEYNEVLYSKLQDEHIDSIMNEFRPAYLSDKF